MAFGGLSLDFIFLLPSILSGLLFMRLCAWTEYLGTASCSEGGSATLSSAGLLHQSRQITGEQATYMSVFILVCMYI